MRGVFAETPYSNHTCRIHMIYITIGSFFEVSVVVNQIIQTKPRPPIIISFEGVVMSCEVKCHRQATGS